MISAAIHIAPTSPAICTLRYIVEFKLNGEDAYQRLYPDPIMPESVDYITLPGLTEGQVYQCRVARICCEEMTQSAFTEFEIET